MKSTDIKKDFIIYAINNLTSPQSLLYLETLDDTELNKTVIELTTYVLENYNSDKDTESQISQEEALKESVINELIAEIKNTFSSEDDNNENLGLDDLDKNAYLSAQ